MNLPNKLTMLRVILVPVFMVFAAFGRIGTSDYDRTAMLAAGIIFAAASFTDFLDGYIARKNHLVTDFGKFMDPLADKMLTTAAFIYMVVDGMCHPVVLAVILFREFAVAGVRMIAAERGTVIAANLWGKVKTVLQMVTIIFYYVVQFFVSSPALIAFILIVQALCWLVAAATVLSAPSICGRTGRASSTRNNRTGPGGMRTFFTVCRLRPPHAAAIIRLYPCTELPTRPDPPEGRKPYMQIFNTMTRRKEEFVPQTPGEYRIYVCGPTVYNYIHMGNARPLVVFDTLRRYLNTAAAR